MQLATTKSKNRTALKRDELIKIERWIECANLIFDYRDLPDAAQASESDIKKVSKRWRSWKQKNFRNQFMAQRAESPSLNPTGSKEQRIYQLLWSVRSALDAIVQEFEDALSSPLETEVEREFDVQLPPPPTGPVIFLKHEYSSQVRKQHKKRGLPVSTENILDFGSYGEFLYALKTIELSRIRRCRRCTRLFYAQRRDKFECTLRCQNAARQARRRGTKAREYEATRKRNKKQGFKAKERIGLHAVLRQGELITKKNESEPYFLKRDE